MGEKPLIKLNELLSWIRPILLALLIVFIIRTFLFQNYIVDGDSMMPTMHDKDRLIVSKIGYTISQPEHFDIIVFHANETKDYIKRVIGLPGDNITYKDDTLYINGEAVKEPYLTEYKQKEDGNFTWDFKLQDITGGVKKVPEDHVFVLGDNRQDSTDSRIIGFVPMDQIVGEVNVKYWPLTDFELYN